MQSTICPWAIKSDIERHYHDTEWGRPLHDERSLFEFLILEGAQAGLSWRTVLAKRERYRKVFDGFDAARIAGYTPRKIDELLADPGIIRNRLKLAAAVTNARACLDLREAEGSLEHWLWQWVDGEPIINHWHKAADVPARTELSDRISKALQHRGFKFVGSTIVYAFMQATGMVNDHLTTCLRHAECISPS